jgi:hypothetical protein
MRKLGSKIKMQSRTSKLLSSSVKKRLMRRVLKRLIALIDRMLFIAPIPRLLVAFVFA